MQIRKSTKKSTILSLGKACERCGHCCTYGSGYVLPDDIKRIAKSLNVKEKEFVDTFLEETERFHTKTYKIKIRRQSKAYGSCMFYDSKVGCTIHTIKPLYCRVSTCSEFGQAIQDWFNLNYFVNPADPESLRQWNVHVRLNTIIPGGQLIDVLPDQNKLKKILNYEIVR